MVKFLKSTALRCTPNNGAHGPTLLIAALLLVMALFNHWQCAITTPTTDFLTYWGVPRELKADPSLALYSREGQKRIYSSLDRLASSWDSPDNMRQAADITSRLYGQRVDATGSPFLYALASALSTGDYQKDQRNFIVLRFLSFIAAVFIFFDIIRYPPLSAVLLLIFFSSFFAPVLSDLRVGNTNQFQLLVIALFMALTIRSKRFWAGLVIGAGIMLKPNIGLVLLLYVFMKVADRDYKPLALLCAGAVAGALTAWSFSALYFGRPGMWLEFAATLPGMLSSSYPVSNGNIALPALIAGKAGLLLPAIIGSVLLILYTVIILTTRPSISQGQRVSVAPAGQNSAAIETFAAAGTGCAILLFSANLAWLHYYILLIPLSVFLLRPSPAGGDMRRGGPYEKTAVYLAAAAALLLCSTPVEFTLNNMVSQSVACNIAGGIILSASLYELWRCRKLARGGKIKSATAMRPQPR